MTNKLKTLDDVLKIFNEKCNTHYFGYELDYDVIEKFFKAEIKELLEQERDNNRLIHKSRPRRP